ncbi:hypothetical protein N9917_00150 [Deltaproteobacteria bacterium]|nr:hypothetical protein [Deltaproteobacteria bacterium]
MKLSTPCGICDSTGWEGHCDCDPDGHHHCRGQGSCGTHECPACKGEGETFAELTPETLAQAFHESYESLAPHFGYKTREASAVPWSDVPDGNKNLMVATAEAVLDRIPTKGATNA